MSNSLLDEETLESLAYERSKIWSNYMKHLEELHDEEVLTLDDLENLYEEDESMSDIEEAVEDNVVEDITNTTMNKSRAELTMMLCSGDNQQEKAKLEEILNQTLPVFEEHERKWKAAGLDRILNTFDARQIEEQVGGWLRLNNSAYFDKSPAKSLNNKCQKHYKASSEYLDCASETESTLPRSSVDRVRYSHASRQHSGGQRGGHSTTSTTIKTYHTVQREKRKKCGYAEYDCQENHRHRNCHCYRQQQRNEQRRRRELEIAYRQTPGHYHHRKHLRKLPSSSPHFNTSSSEDEYGRIDPHCSCPTCARRARTTCSCCAYVGHHQRMTPHAVTASQSLECARSMRKLRHCESSIRKIRRQPEFDEDLLPRVLENECSCCNSDRLCSDVVHIANSSTEEWVVENSIISEEVMGPMKRERTSSDRLRQATNLLKATTMSVKKPLSKGPAIALPQIIENIERPFTTLKTAKKKKLTNKAGEEISAENPKLMHPAPYIQYKNVAKPSQPKKFLHKELATDFADENDYFRVEKKLSKRNISEEMDKPLTADIVKKKKAAGPFLSGSAEEPKVIQPSQAEKNIFAKQKQLKSDSGKVTEKATDKPLTTAKIVKKKKASAPILFQIREEEPQPIQPIKKNSEMICEEEPKLIKSTQPQNKNVSQPKTSQHKEFAADSASAKETEKPLATTKIVKMKKAALPVAAQVSQVEPKSTQCTNLEQNKIAKSSHPSATKPSPPQQQSSTNSADECSYVGVKKKPSAKAVEAKTNKPLISPKIDKKKKRTQREENSGSKTSRIIPQKQYNVSSKSADESTDSDVFTSFSLKPKAKLAKQKKSSTASADDLDKDLKLAIALSKETFKLERLKLQQQKQQRDGDPELPPTARSAEPLFFNNHSVACNSTALANDTACARALNTKRNVKHAADVSSTQHNVNQFTSSSAPSMAESAKENKLGDDADCTVVTSTTGYEAAATAAVSQKPPIRITEKGILLHAPNTSSSFTLTEQCLSGIIGERTARKLLKYHGSRSFDSNCSVYYRPTSQLAAALSGGEQVVNLDSSHSSSASDDDVFECIERYGELYTVLEKSDKAE